MSKTALLMERSHFETGLAAVADVFDTTKSTDVINMANHNRVRFIVFWGVGATGTNTITVEACSNLAASSVSAIGFRYRRLSAVDVAPGAITVATSAGFTTTAGSNQIYEIEVAVQDLLASGYQYVRLTTVEVVNSPILGGVLVEVFEPRYADGSETSATV